MLPPKEKALKTQGGEKANPTEPHKAQGLLEEKGVGLERKKGRVLDTMGHLMGTFELRTSAALVSVR
jgi:hypothetical protein